MPPAIATPAPVTPPSPAPAAPAPAAPAPEAPIASSFDNVFPDDGLDSVPEPKPAPVPPDKQNKPTPAPKDSDKQKAPAAAKEPEPDKQSQEPDKPADELGTGDYEPPKVSSAKDLKTWAYRMGSRAKKAEAELNTLKTRLTQIESQPNKSAEENAKMAQELADLKKRYEETDKKLRYKAYEESDEYATKYDRPYKDAVAAAYQDVKELLVTEPDPNNPEEQRERPATVDDFNEIYMADLGVATKLAAKKFGPAAAIVLNHRKEIRTLAAAKYRAVEEYKARGGEIETQNKAREAQIQAGKERMFTVAAEDS